MFLLEVIGLRPNSENVKMKLDEIKGIRAANGGMLAITLGGERKSIGLGIARLLASIPTEGIKPEEYKETSPDSARSWLIDVLLPLGLVREGDSGKYVRTPLAEGIDYTFMPSQKDNPPRQRLFPCP